MLKKLTFAVVLSLAVMIGLERVSFSQNGNVIDTTPAETPAADSAKQAVKENATKNETKKEENLKPIKEVLPDAEKIDGLITLYRKKDQLFAEIKSSNLDTDYLIAMAVAKGSGVSVVGGFTLGTSGDDKLWQFRKAGDRIHIVRRNIKFKADSGTPEESAVDVAYSDNIVYRLPILAVGDNGGDVIDFGSIFLSDFAGLSSNIGTFSRDRSYWGNIKGFPNNIEFRVVATYSGLQDGSYFRGIAPSDKDGTSVTIHYSVSKLPSSGYVPRIADNRIGYFLTAHKNYSKNHNDNHIIRYINRWNLQKADPNAELSPPKKPILFWISKTVPFRYRNAVREGILEWNKAFERIGFVNAIEVRQQTDNDTWDAEDINYNTFRWIRSDVSFAQGPSHVNPITGEILDADIIFDATFIDSWRFTFDKIITDVIPPNPQNLSDNEWKIFITNKNSNGNFLYSHRHEHDEISDTDNINNDSGNLNLRGDSMKNGFCSYANDRASQLAIASLLFVLSDNENTATDNDKKINDENEEINDIDTENNIVAESVYEENDKSKKNKSKKDNAQKSERQKVQKKLDAAFDRFVFEGLKDVVMHEVGHTLGLRHNFKASSWLTLDEINDTKRSKEYGIAGSVMDYLPVNIAPEGKPQGDYFMTALGPYDYLAIEYGYKKLSGGTDGEIKKLQAIASRQAEKGNHYAPDEDVANHADPLAIKRDLGSQPIDYAKSVTELYHQLLPKILDRAAKDGDSYKDIPKLYFAILLQRTNALTFLARNIGGQYRNRDHRGDPGNRNPVQIVDAKTQRESVDFICETVFSRDSFSIPADLYNKFGEEIWLIDNHMPHPPQINIGDLFLKERLNILKRLTSPNTLTRINDSQFRVNSNNDAYTVEELFDSLTKTIFKELETIVNGDFSNNKPAIDIQQRDLQSNYFQLLSAYTLYELQNSASIPANVQPITKHQLSELLTKIETVLKSEAKLDAGSQLHLEHLKSQIEKVFNATLSINKH
jgi:hypothetical protein